MRLGMALDDAGELDLQAARHDHAVLGFHEVGDAALARLAVDANHRVVAAADVGRVDRKIGHRPLLIRLLSGKPLLDGVLVGAGEGRENEITDVRVARVDRELGAVFESAGDGIDVGEVEAGIDALRVHVEGEGDEIDVAGALAVAEEAALDAVGAGHEAEFGGGDGGAAVVVRVEADDDAVAAREISVHPLDLVGVDVGRGDLDRGREIEDDLALLASRPKPR